MKEEYKSYKIGELVKRMEAVEKENKELAKTNEKLQSDVKLWSNKFNEMVTNIRDKVVLAIIEQLADAAKKQQDEWFEDVRKKVVSVVDTNLNNKTLQKLKALFDNLKAVLTEEVFVGRLNNRFYTSFLMNQNDLIVSNLIRNRAIKVPQARTMDNKSVQDASNSIEHLRETVRKLNVSSDIRDRILERSNGEIGVFRKALWAAKKK